MTVESLPFTGSESKLMSRRDDRFLANFPHTRALPLVLKTVAERVTLSTRPGGTHGVAARGTATFPLMAKRRRRPKLRAPEGLGNVLARAGEDRFARNELPVAPHVWAAAVGVRIADRTRPISIEGGVLLVRTATSVWANELSLLSETLVTRLRAAGVPIRSMRFRVGPIDPPERVTWVRSAKVPRPRPLEADLARAIARVPDAELREVIAEAAKTNLAWQTMTEPAVASGEPRAARAPRGAERESGRPAQESSASRGASRGTRGDA